MAIYYDSKPVDVDTTFDPTSENAVSGVAVKEAIDEAVQSMYKPGGSILFSNLPELSVNVLGFVYNITDAFTTDTRFVEGAGTECAAGTNVVVVNTGTSQNPVYKFDILAAGAVQVQSDWAQSDTSAVDFIKNKPTIPAVNTAGTGISISNGAISVASPTLINKSTGNNSLNIDGSSYYNYDRVVTIGKESYTTSYNSVALGAYANAGQYGTALGYGTAASGTSAIAIGLQAATSSTTSNAMQIGKGTNNESNTVKFGNGTNNWTLLDLTTGKIPADRLPTISIDEVPNITNQNENVGAVTPLKVWEGTSAQYDTDTSTTVEFYAWAAREGWGTFYTKEYPITTSTTLYWVNSLDDYFVLPNTIVYTDGTSEFTDSNYSLFDYTPSENIGGGGPEADTLYFVEGQGVKIGNTLIADKADLSEYLKKHQIDTNGNYTSEFEYSPADSENPTTDVTVWYKNNGDSYFGSLRASNTGVSLVGQGSSGAHLTQNGQYFVTNTPIKSNFYTVGEGTIITKGYLANNYPDNSSLAYNDNNYSLEVKGIKNSELTDSSTTLKIWEGNSTEYTEEQQSKTYYAWRTVDGEDVTYFYTLTATPSVGDLVAYNTPDLFRFEITATDGSTYIEIFDGDFHADRYSEGDITRTATIDANTLCFIEGVGVKRNNVDIATKITLDSVPTQGSTNGITSGAVYTVLGDIEATLDAIIAQGSNS